MPKTGNLLVSLLVTATAELSAAESWPVKRTEFGHPDLQGTWFYGAGTPFERPLSLGTQRDYTAEQAEAVMRDLLDADTLKQQSLDADRDAPESGVAIQQEADHNFAASRTNLIRLDGRYRTSQIIEPADGRLPVRAGGRDFFERWLDAGFGAYDGPELRPVSERCAGPNGGPMAPMIGWFYNANMEIVQTEDYVVILAEMNHDARIIPLAASISDPPFPRWMGHSRGFWDGDTLVVETSGFRPEQSWFAFRMSDQLRVTERFRLVSDDEIHYSYTFEDPVIYLEPVTVEKNIVRRPPGEHVFEYACHEGNYSFPSILAGARRLELENGTMSD